MLEELLPSPVLSVGLAGHRHITIDGVAGEPIEQGVGAVLGALQRALPPAIAQEAAYFSANAPVVRLVTVGADGAELLGTRAAVKLGLQVSYVVPFAVDDYRNDFSPAAKDAATETMSHAVSLLELPGRREEGPRAYERAHEVMLSNIDLLVAVWDGGWARGRADTADVVQAAVIKSIPIIVIDPQSPSAPAILATPPIDAFEAPAASDLDRRALPADLVDFVHAILSPPPRAVQRKGLVDLMAETSSRAAEWRIEYPLLLKLIVGRPQVRPPSAAAAKPEHPLVAVVRSSASDAKAVDAVERARATIDALAVRYGRLFRSSLVSKYLVVILGVWVSGVLGLLVPSLSSASIAVQVVVNALVLADSAIGSRHRWQERWLDYRVVAERLRWLSFRYAFGLGAGRQTQPDIRMNTSWTDWYLQRMGHALGLPTGKIDAASVAAAADQMTENEIPDQIRYHRITVRQLGTLERRLSFAAQGSLAAAAVVGALLGIEALRAGSLEAVGWKPFAIVLLAVLPATMTGLNGLRVDADLIRLVERSAQTIALLFRIRRAILATPRDYDHVATNMHRLAAIMGNELADWRFVIESRRSRGGRRPLGKKSALKRVLVRARQKA